MTRPLRIACLALSLGTLLAGPADAGLWKWTDANGRVVYSDLPPSGDVKAERVAGPPPAANPQAAKQLVQQEAEFKRRQMQRNEDETKVARAKNEASQLQEQCTQMRGHLKALQMPEVQHYRINEKGEREFLNEAAVKSQRERVESFLRDRCAEVPAK